MGLGDIWKFLPIDCNSYLDCNFFFGGVEGS